MIRSRNVRVSFDAVPRHWFAGNAAGTHLSNALNLLFPAGERFFIRSVRHYLDQFKDDPKLMAEVRGFFGQEGNHAREHERFFEILESQGFEIRSFLERYERVMFEVVERTMPPALRLSATAACEHFTASLADNALRSDIFRDIHPQMKRLLLWHAAEEIEHKAVAFDILQKVAPSYAVRVAGLAFATFFLLFWWFMAFRMLMAQEGLSLREGFEAIQDRGEVPDAKAPHEVIAEAILEYLDPNFHPWKQDNADLAQDYIASMSQAA